ncbi:Helix-turn-helix domain-containing protein [Sphingopyxis sp. YR583]|uniref:XRE family transcriptional regulator n=1 Tax=Sphingopyxis sp. YR583 TaxID=1881047 RepID=UPI0008A72687|nr:XRE family transcriptional regulator [Sphingopyxis sp. YR583]SEH12895.1 Helix-turn-helix domain-containing protein [Sphingopyxis sp. YR583]
MTSPTLPKAIGEFIDAVRSEVAAAVDVDAPAKADGEWWIDIEIDGMQSQILWQKSSGFGVYVRETGFGARPQEIYRKATEAGARVLQLAAQWKKDATHHALRLNELRHLLGETQGDVAKALNLDQARISKIENAADMKISTLLDFLAAMGGTLELRARFSSLEAAIEPVDPVRRKVRVRHAA